MIFIQLRLRIMDESAQRLNAEEKIKSLEQDIESLKDKITQLLLWVENILSYFYLFWYKDYKIRYIILQCILLYYNVLYLAIFSCL